MIHYSTLPPPSLSCSKPSTSSFSPPPPSFLSRVSFVSPSSFHLRFGPLPPLLSRRSSTCPCVLSSPNVHAMDELLKDNNLVASSQDEKQSHPRTFLDATTEEELLAGIRKEVEAGRLPSNVATGMDELYQNYKIAVLQSGIPNAMETIVSNMAVVLDRIFLDVEDPFVFSPYHKALRKPFDYYKFGQNYIRPLVDFGNSYVGNISLFKDIEERLLQGHNVVLISNHQTEADPAVIALLLETTYPYIAENLIYVAGDRVVTDPLCKPFSIGRNLICVYSKKHMNDNPELADMKKKANIRALKEMAVLFRMHLCQSQRDALAVSMQSLNECIFAYRGGSRVVWIAPSGGRDRPDPQTGDWFPAPFDASSVDNMRRLASHSGAPGHVYPLALLCHDIMPPPAQVEKEIGERREISFHGVGLSVASEISYPDVTAACENSEEAKEIYSQILYKTVTEQYNVLNSAIHGKQGLESSIPTVSLSQPWD